MHSWSCECVLRSFAPKILPVIFQARLDKVFTWHLPHIRLGAYQCAAVSERSFSQGLKPPSLLCTYGHLYSQPNCLNRRPLYLETDQGLPQTPLLRTSNRKKKREKLKDTFLHSNSVLSTFFIPSHFHCLASGPWVHKTVGAFCSKLYWEWYHPHNWAANWPLTGETGTGGIGAFSGLISCLNNHGKCLKTWLLLSFWFVVLLTADRSALSLHLSWVPDIC